MPTGYTAGIIDGKTKTFKEFALECARNFGALIHMRDEPMNVPIKEREPSEYHTREVQRANEDLKRAMESSDEDLIAFERRKLEDRILRYSEMIQQRKSAAISLNKFLSEAQKYHPPTSEHYGLKDFMIQQLTETIKYDGDSKYFDKELSQAQIELSTLDAERIRKAMIEAANKDIAYHQEEYNKDVQGCERANKWVKEFIESLENY
jgi:hypothetical protein